MDPGSASVKTEDREGDGSGLGLYVGLAEGEGGQGGGGATTELVESLIQVNKPLILPTETEAIL